MTLNNCHLGNHRYIGNNATRTHSAFEDSFLFVPAGIPWFPLYLYSSLCFLALEARWGCTLPEFFSVLNLATHEKMQSSRHPTTTDEPRTVYIQDFGSTLMGWEGKTPGLALPPTAAVAEDAPGEDPFVVKLDQSDPSLPKVCSITTCRSSPRSS